MESTDRRRQLAEEMDRRRAELRLTWDQVAQRADISIATLRRVRNGSGPISLDTMIGIDNALQWNTGHVEARIEGRDPSAPRESSTTPDVGATLEELRRLRDELNATIAGLEKREHQRRPTG